MTEANLADGVMTIHLDGGTVDLLANAEMASLISREYGGLTPLYGRLNAHDFDAAVWVINAAAGRRGTPAAAGTAGQVFRRGIVSVNQDVLSYLGFLSSGGRAPARNDAPGEPPAPAAAVG